MSSGGLGICYPEDVVFKDDISISQVMTSSGRLCILHPGEMAG